MKPQKLGLVTVAGLIIAGVGIIAPILWDQYKTKAAIEVRLLSNSVVATPSRELEKLQFFYDGNPVPSLSRIELALTNTGRTPIRQEDIVSPVTLRIRNARILEARINRLVPADLAITHGFNASQDGIEFQFPLLNPGDTAFFTIMAATERAEIEVAARIAGVKSLSYVEVPSETTRPRRQLTLAFYIVAGMTGVCGLVFLIGLVMTGSETAIAKVTKNGLLKPPTLDSPRDYIQWLNREFLDKSTELKKHVFSWLEPLPQTEALTETQQQELHQRIKNALVDVTGTKATLAFFGILTLVGGVYVAYRLWQ